MPKKAKNKNYFTKDTEEAIVAYNNTDDIVKKHRLYHTRIHYPFFKLTENIIHTFKYYYTKVDNIEDLQHEVITFLLSKIHLFNPDKGAKAYSYFGTIAKRYLILSNQKNYKKRINNTPVEDLYKDDNFSYMLDDENPTLASNSPAQESLSKFVDYFVDYCTNNIYELFPKKNDAQVADAILELFRKREYINIFNKKALYINIRENIDAKTPKITKIKDKLKYIFDQNYDFFLREGYVAFDSVKVDYE